MVVKVVCGLLLVALISAKNTHVVLVPKVIRPGLPLNVSVNILQAAGDVQIDVKVTSTNNGVVVASSTASAQQGNPLNIKLEIPQSLSSGKYDIAVKGSKGANFSNHAAITYKAKSLSAFIQTDKAVYKPSQTVNFRVIGVHPDLLPYTGEMDIEIHDAKGNKIKQWLKTRNDRGVITNKLALSDQPVLGDWKIKVIMQGESTEKSFTIDEYVLPKFEVTVKLPSYALTKDLRLSGTVKAMYTYGKPVKGTANIRIGFQNKKHGVKTISQTMQLEEGEKPFVVEMNQLKQLGLTNLNGKVIQVEANVTETLTGNTLSGASAVKYYDHAVKLEFLTSNPKNYKPGLTYTAYMKVSQQDGLPLSGARATVTTSTKVTTEEPTGTSVFHYPHISTHSLVTPSFSVPENGLVPVIIQIPKDKFSTKMAIKAHYPDATDATLNINRMHSPSNSFIQIVLNSQRLQTGDEASFELKSTSPMTTVIYQVMSRGSIVSSGQIDASNQTTKTFGIEITPNMAPSARIVVYYVRKDGEIVTDSISFGVQGVFQNKVSINFAQAKSQPGEKVDVTVTADPDSLVHLLAVDQSVLLLKSGNDITENQVSEELQSFDTVATNKHVGFHLFNQIGLRGKRMLWWPFYPVYFDGAEAKEVFNNAGVLVLTDATLYHYSNPYHYLLNLFGHGFLNGGLGLINTGAHTLASALPHTVIKPVIKPPPADKLQDVGRVRKIFPETWLWASEVIGSNGSSVISATVPDTITSWVASAFAVNSHSGLGISPSTAKLQAFRPFFVSLNLPYSVIRGEEVALEAMVFNYLENDMTVVVTLAKSSSYRNLGKDKDGNTVVTSETQTKRVEIPAGEARSVYYPIIPAALGAIDITVKAQSTMAADAVQRQLLVEPEGVPKEYNNAIMVDLTHNTTFSRRVPVSFPPSTVYGSKRVTVSVIGDLMGPTVHGLDKLLRMPTGCGEQTMLNFAPDIFISKYLAATQQLTGAVKEKALGLLEKGYQRELTYQHKDGSFSAFGDRDSSGSMWLTAFVAKSFHQAKPFIYVDDQTLIKAIQWILNHQKPDGSFPEPGRIIHKNMQGGSAAGVSLTSFVLIALLENSDLDVAFESKIHTAAMKTRSYLENQLTNITDDYGLAITTYALVLAKSSKAETALQLLNHEAIIKDGTRHWEIPIQQSTRPMTHHYWRLPTPREPAINVETTAYGLLTYAERNQLVAGQDILKWLTAQRNPHGGFSSTQDTVIALQALSEFSEKIFSPTFDVIAHVADDVNRHDFRVQRENALVYQTTQMTNVSDHVTVTASGNGMTLVQVTVNYNVEEDETEPSFDLKVDLLHETTHSITIQACAKWLKDGSSGMAVEEIGIPSGFQINTHDIELVNGLKRIETSDRKIILYFDEISTTVSCLTVKADRTGIVGKSKPAPVRVYDYYEPDNQVTVFYESKVLQGASICDICGTECNCCEYNSK